MANIPQEPRRQDYSTERAYAQAWAAWRNLQEAQRIASLNFSNDDGQNQGTVNSAATQNSQITATNPNFSRQRSTSSLSESGIDAPGLRPNNVLSELSSYNYSLTLYMVSTEAVREYILSGGQFPANRPDVFIVAQSAGVNNASEQRLITKSRQLGPGQQGYDYYIDDLSLMTVMPGNAVTGSTTSFDVKFKIYEPLGFSFVQDLLQMSRRLNQISPSARASGSVINQFEQNYILGIKFYGYDVNGTPVKYSDPRFQKYTNGTTDPNSVAERYLNINFSNFTYSVDDKSTEYTVEAAILSERMAYGQINGVSKNNINLVGTTVEDLLVGQTTQGSSIGSKSLVNILNSKNQDLKDKNYTEDVTTYRIEFLDKNGKVDTNSPIAKARVPNNTDVNRLLTPMAEAKNPQQVTVNKSVNSQTNDVSKQEVTVAAGSPILKVIENIIVSSSYVTNALNTSTDQTPETTSKTNPTSTPLEWFSINTITIPKKKDAKTNYMSFDIVYQIIPSEIVYARSQYVNRTTPYKGPFKYYEYIFTGKNTEILKYEQEFNAQFFMAKTTTDSSDKTPLNNIRDSGTPIIPQTKTGGDRTGIKNNGGADIQQEVKANLYSLADRTRAKIKILGDPDYIMTGIGVDQTAKSRSSSSVSRYYNPDLSINPFSGQVLVEIKFYSPEDYTDQGLLDAKGLVQFYETTAPIEAGITGVVYRVLTVESSFSRGVFTQTLDMVIVPENELLGKQSQTSSGRENNTINSSSTNSDVRTQQQVASDEFFFDSASRLTTDDEFFSDSVPRLTTDDEFFSDINDDRVLPTNRSISEVTEERARVINDRTDENLGVGGFGGIVGA